MASEEGILASDATLERLSADHASEIAALEARHRAEIEALEAKHREEIKQRDRLTKVLVPKDSESTKDLHGRVEAILHSEGQASDAISRPLGCV